MVGRELTNRFPPKTNKPGDVILDVQHIAGKYTRLKDATFQLRKGEVLGIAGLDGSGRTEGAGEPVRRHDPGGRNHHPPRQGDPEPYPQGVH